MRKALIILIAAIISVCAYALAPKPRTSQQVKQEQAAARQRVAQTQKQIDDNRKRLRRSVNQLASVTADIETLDKHITIVKAEIARLDGAIAALSDSVAMLEADVERMRQSTMASLREARSRRQTMTATSLVFSSSNFGQAMKRISYLRQLDRSRLKKTAALKQTIALLDDKRAELERMRVAQAQAMATLDHQQQRLAKSQAQMAQLVADLRRDGAALERELADRQQQLKALEAELDRIIAEELAAARDEERRRQEAAAQAAAQQAAAQQAQPAQGSNRPANSAQPAKSSNSASAASAPSAAAATAALTGDFAANKGRLPYPVAGQHSVVAKFGVNKHVDFSRVEVDNPGIDIETASGAQAQAVFDGKVSSIFHLAGYHNIVMVRHGEYLTIYANIDQLLVKKGDTVSAGQPLGSIYADPDDSGRSVLHFEVRKEREKLNPLDWLQ